MILIAIGCLFVLDDQLCISALRYFYYMPLYCLSMYQHPITL